MAALRALSTSIWVNCTHAMEALVAWWDSTSRGHQRRHLAARTFSADARSPLVAALTPACISGLPTSRSLTLYACAACSDSGKLHSSSAAAAHATAGGLRSGGQPLLLGSLLAGDARCLMESMRGVQRHGPRPARPMSPRGGILWPAGSLACCAADWSGMGVL